MKRTEEDLITVLMCICVIVGFACLTAYVTVGNI